MDNYKFPRQMDVDLLAKNHCARVPTDEKSRPYILQLGHNDQGRALCPITGYLQPKNWARHKFCL